MEKYQQRGLRRMCCALCRCGILPRLGKEYTHECCCGKVVGSSHTLQKRDLCFCAVFALLKKPYVCKHLNVFISCCGSSIEICQAKSHTTTCCLLSQDLATVSESAAAEN